MLCPTPGSHMESVCKTVVSSNHAANLNHRCSIGECRYTCRRHQRGYLCVCKDSLHYHMCYRGTCTLGQKASDTTMACAISGMELKGADMVYYAQRTKGRGSSTRPFTHTMTIRTPKNRKLSAPGDGVTRIKKLIRTLLVSPEARMLRSKRRLRRLGRFKAALANTNDFLRQMEITRGIVPKLSLAGLSDTLIDKLAHLLAAYIQKLKAVMVCHKGINAVVAACVSFMATGVQCNGVQVIPRIPWVAHFAPAPADYSKITGFQSRPMSVASRAIKAAMFGVGGRPKHNLIFYYPED